MPLRERREKKHHLCHVNVLKPYYTRSSGDEEWEFAEDGKPVILASTVTLLGPFCHAMSVHGEEDVLGPDYCVLSIVY